MNIKILKGVISVISICIGLGMLVVVLIIAETKFGAKNWIEINNTTIQPSEFVKIIYVFFSF